jgi:hypothetical protein
MSQLADVFFALFAAVFIFTRNYVFPVYIIASIPLYAYDEDGNSYAGEDHVRHAAIFALCILEGLHIYWASLVCLCPFLKSLLIFYPTNRFSKWLKRPSCQTASKTISETKKKKRHLE